MIIDDLIRPVAVDGNNRYDMPHRLQDLDTFLKLILRRRKDHATYLLQPYQQFGKAIDGFGQKNFITRKFSGEGFLDIGTDQRIRFENEKVHSFLPLLRFYPC